MIQYVGQYIENFIVGGNFLKRLELKEIRDMPVMQVTFDPKGPGAVRIHLVPPRVSKHEEIAPGLIFINGNDIIPVRKGHTILLANLMKEIANYEGKEITDEDMNKIVDNTIKRTRRVYYKTSKKVMANDLRNLIEDFCRLAYGQPLESQYDAISIGDYAKYMRGPHRMDIMVSAMTDSSGNWHCNNKCLHCYAAGQKLSEQSELSTDEWKEVLEKMYDAYVTQITFTGGEPTLRKDLPELIRYAKYFVTRLNTNGILLTKDYCRELVEAELDSIQVTLYSVKEEVHNRLVGSNTWKSTVQGIKNAVDAGLSVSINTPLCAINSEYEETLKFINELGVRYVSCSSIITTGNALQKEAEHTQLTEEELIGILQKATAYCKEKQIEISFTSPGWVSNEVLQQMNLKVPSCGACLSNMAITPNGKVVPCQSWLEGLELGDILHEDWSTIWNSFMCEKIRSNSSKMEGICPLRKK